MFTTLQLTWCVASKRWRMLKIAERKFNFNSILNNCLPAESNLLDHYKRFNHLEETYFVSDTGKRWKSTIYFWWPESLSLLLSRVNSDVNKLIVCKHNWLGGHCILSSKQVVVLISYGNVQYHIYILFFDNLYK